MAKFIPLTGADMPLIENFWADYEQEFQKTSFNAKRELAYAKALARLLPEGWLLGGGLLVEDRLVAMSLAENCGGTLIIHVEKALYSHQGAYPTLVQAFAAHFGGDCVYINREDDAGDRGLRTSKLQYLPVRLAGKLRFEVQCEADRLREIPTVTTPRLTLTPLEERDEAAYNALCLDDARNRWWGYDYRQDLKGELTEDYFLSVARRDFAARRAVNFAVRLDRQLIGEVVLYRFDWRGGAELGCRIDPAYAGHGYGAEAFAAAADWALFRLSLARGRSRRRAGRSNAASFPERPQRDMISMTPLHRHSTPAMAMHSCTAAPAPSRAAAPTASMVPFHAAKISDTAAIPVQIQAIAICIPPLAHVYDRENTQYS